MSIIVEQTLYIHIKDYGKGCFSTKARVMKMVWGGGYGACQFVTILNYGFWCIINLIKIYHLHMNEINLLINHC